MNEIMLQVIQLLSRGEFEEAKRIWLEAGFDEESIDRMIDLQTGGDPDDYDDVIREE